jgi:hypothetical protein
MNVFVETYDALGSVPGVNYLCYPHGAASLGSQYYVMVRSTGFLSSTWRAYGGSTGGTAYESFAGFTSPVNTWA